ncbi:MAG: LysR family transcriptional regulator [Rhizobacter sp.]|nr:LysR family transcriptional regulator [Rhizobacter sp.]
MDRLSGLEVFVQTAVTESFVGAGRALGLTPSAVSKSISRLEERVGVRLFQRSTRSVRLTSEGQTFLDRCRRIMEEIEVAENELSEMSQKPRGRLKVGLPLAGGLPLPVISAFMEAHPDIELDLDFSDRVADVIDEGLDVVIRGGELEDSRLMSKRLGSFRILLVASPAYLARHGKPAKPADLVDHACLHYRYPTTGRLEAWPLRRSPAASGDLQLPMTLVAGSLEALRYLVLEGRGITCLPDFAVKNQLSSGQLTTVLDAHMNRPTTFRILWPSSKQLTPKVRVFVDFFVERFGKELYSQR